MNRDRKEKGGLVRGFFFLLFSGCRSIGLDELNQAGFRAVADTVTGADDAGVAAVSLLKALGEIGEQLFDDKLLGLRLVGRRVDFELGDRESAVVLGALLANEMRRSTRRRTSFALGMVV